MRGVAAFAVVCEHYAGNIGGYYPAFGHLAVDLFFVLSGFVLESAYGKRLAQGLSVLEFMKARAIRLWPLILIGSILGIAAQLVRPSAGLTHGQLAIAAAFNLLALPSPFADNRWQHAFPINGPFWSLFFEFWVANWAFAAFYRRLTAPVLWTIVGAGALGLVIAEVMLGSIASGFSVPTAWVGFARVAFSFSLGILLARRHIRAPVPIAIPGGVILVGLAAVLFAPIGGPGGRVFELGSVFLAFPAFVLLGSNAVERAPAVGKLLGEASFTLYAVHWPIVELLMVGEPGSLRSRKWQLLIAITLTALSIPLAFGETKLRHALKPRGGVVDEKQAGSRVRSG